MKATKNIIFLTDYKNRFESKFNDVPYRSGLDQNLISNLCFEKGYHAVFINARNIETIEKFDTSTPIIISSIEEAESSYRSFLLDIVEHLDRSGYTLIPKVEFLKAHENKVFMELLRKQFKVNGVSDLKTLVFGNVQDFKSSLNDGKIQFPTVLKGASGAKSKNVYLAHNKNEALKIAVLISEKKSFNTRFKDLLRAKRHKNYTRESHTKHKFIVQEFIPELKNDWKILIFHDKLFVLSRGIKSNDFRASGQGKDYKSGRNSDFPEKYLNDLYSFYKALNTPYVSLDVAIKNEQLYIFEYQCILFGKSTITMSDEYFQLKSGEWELTKNEVSQEALLVHSIISYFSSNGQ